MIHRCPHCQQQVSGVLEIFSTPFKGDELALVQALIGGKTVTHEQLIRMIFGTHTQLISPSNSLAQLVKNANHRMSRTSFRIVSRHRVGYQLLREI